MPRTLDDLLAMLPGLGRLRSLDAELLRKLLDRPPNTCTWCGFVLPRGRREWCGDACVEAFHRRCDPTYVRRLVLARDNGVCQACGRDTFAAEAEYKAESLALFPGSARDMALKARLGFARGRWREVDHKRPVCEGGGLCGPDDLWVLCAACHAKKCAAAARRAVRRCN